MTKLFPKFLAKSDINELASHTAKFLGQSRTPPELDSFLDTFFRETLPSSTKLQSVFHITDHQPLINSYLKNRSTRLERVNYLLTKLDRLFLINNDVQRIAVRSQQYRELIDRLIQDEKVVTAENFIGENTRFTANENLDRTDIRLPGLEFKILNVYSQYLTSKQQEHIRKIILSDYFQDDEVRNFHKVLSFRVLRRFKRSYDETVESIKQSLPNETEERTKSSGRGLNNDSLKDILVCLPATFDYNPEKLLEYFHYLKTKLNAANAKYISDAFLTLSQRMPDQMFLQAYFELISSEQFPKLGITANKEVLRLLIQYSNQTDIVESIIKPWWHKKPHQDIRACLASILLHFFANAKTKEQIDSVWSILEEAADDEYKPVIETLFTHEGNQTWPLLRLKKTANPIFEKFVNEIQFKILDHSKSLEFRSAAWMLIDCEFVDVNRLVKKTQDLSCLFDKNGNTLWDSALRLLMKLYKLNRMYVCF